MKTAVFTLFLALTSYAFSSYEGDWYFDVSSAPAIAKDEHQDFVRRAFGEYTPFVLGKKPFRIEEKEDGKLVLHYPMAEEMVVTLTPKEKNRFKGNDGLIYEIRLDEETLSLRFWKRFKSKSAEEFRLIKRSEQGASHNAGKPAS
ncbi:hypothetical protein [Pelagicoccus sp. SDUM812002]|uniref:hypothetical protein n=1 Tax=Pelagicoccus sp. SDUM812002 TaxID=3041266 RepID=UPI00280FEBA1|nr:hypothetical protein [Pelagicoccus sp. SDUM812002]MDQ8188555.1 hypothetical protein [Pelagicoccus sp. SDUM812002]